MMQVTIAGSIADFNSITFSENGFGKFTDNNEVQYEFEIDAKDFFQRFSDIYADCIVELVRDDDVTGKFHPPYTGATSYPSLEELLLILESHRMEMIDAYFVFDILRIYMQEDAVSVGIQWIIKSLDSLSRQGDVISISGRAIPKC